MSTEPSGGRPSTRRQTPQVQQIQEALRDLSGQLGRLNQAVSGYVDLRPVDLEVLDVIARRGPFAPSELAQTLGIHPATLTGILDRLEGGGWIQRQADSVDRRRISISALGRRGAELLRLYRPMASSIAEICASYSSDQLELILVFLRRIADAGQAAVEIVGEDDD